jgi:hypothetical protein
MKARFIESALVLRKRRRQQFLAELIEISSVPIFPYRIQIDVPVVVIAGNVGVVATERATTALYFSVRFQAVTYKNG